MLNKIKESLMQRQTTRTKTCYLNPAAFLAIRGSGGLAGSFDSLV